MDVLLQFFWARANTRSKSHCVKSVRIRSYSGPHFPAFGLNKERYSVSLRIQSACLKYRTRITPNMDTFHAVSPVVIWRKASVIISILENSCLHDESNIFNISLTWKEAITKTIRKSLFFNKILDQPLTNLQKMIFPFGTSQGFGNI